MDSFGSPSSCMNEVDQLRGLAESCWRRGWAPAGSCSFSMVLDRQPMKLLTTVGNSCRGTLQVADFAIVDQSAEPTDGSSLIPTDETKLHAWLAQNRQANVIAQTHSVWSALLADRFGPLEGVLLEGYELLQRLPGVASKAHSEWLPIVMFYDQSPLVEAAERTLNDVPVEITSAPRAIVVQQYGLLTWAENTAQAQNQIELFEYFCEYLIRRASFT
jgi:methylthioribulose-1-phosphate dehydratase